jgi:hypothetical protein
MERTTAADPPRIIPTCGSFLRAGTADFQSEAYAALGTLSKGNTPQIGAGSPLREDLAADVSVKESNPGRQNRARR